MKDLYRHLQLHRSASDTEVRQRLAAFSADIGSLGQRARHVLLSPGRRVQYDRVHHAVAQIAQLREMTGLAQQCFASRVDYSDFRKARSTHQYQSNPSVQPHPSSRGFPTFIGAILSSGAFWGLAVIAGLWFFATLDSRKPPAPVQLPPRVQQPSQPNQPLRVAQPSPAPIRAQPTALPLPTTGSFDVGKSSTHNSIVVSTRGDRNVLVKLETLQGREVTQGFIRAGETHRFNLPAGTYVLKTASGGAWYGSDLRFGDDTQYARADDTFPLLEPGVYWTVELIPRRDGNLREVRIGANDF